MELYLIRHGIAVERGIYDEDRDRPLTDKGIARTQQVAQRLQTLGLQFDWILTSPFCRASQTAQILIEAGLGETLETSELLEPDRPIEPWLYWLSAWPPAQIQDCRLALVGHEPNWGDWAEQLIFGEIRGHLSIKKAGIVGLSLPPFELLSWPEVRSPLGTSQLFWLAPPRLLL